MKYKISRAAYQDLEDIWYYTFKNWSLKQADRYLHQIMDEIEFLALHPLSGKDYSTVRAGYLRSKVKSHYIFYRMNEENNLIEIIRILHESMDIPTRLKK